MTLMEPGDLSEAERLVWTAFPRGGWADLTVLRAAASEVAAEPASGTAAEPVSDPATETGAAAEPASCGEMPVVRAEVLSSLLRREPHLVNGRMPALRLRGARITGDLALSFSRIDVPIHLHDCLLDAAGDVTGAAVRTIELRRCRMPGLEARLLEVAGDLRIADCEVNGCLMVENARISGSFSVGGTRLTNPGARALSGGGMTIGGGLFGRRGLYVEGTLRIIGARVEGGVFLEGAVLHSPGSVALCADEVVTTRIVCTDGFDIDGEVQLRRAQVSGEVNLYAATLRSPGKAVRARGLAAGELILMPEAVSGLVDLSRARLGAIRDSARSWPEKLRLDGTTYEHLLPVGEPVDVRARCRWLHRDAGSYRPQPYEQLADYYRRLGHDDDARRVLLAKQRRRRQTLNPLARLVGYLLDGLVGYGYRAWLAAVWLGVLLAAGTAVFGVWTPLALDPAHQPHFDAFVYTLDLLIPIGAFGLRVAYVPVGGTRWVAYALIAAGWILATALVAGVSRSLRRE